MQLSPGTDWLRITRWCMGTLFTLSLIAINHAIHAQQPIVRNQLQDVIPFFITYAEGARQRWGVPGMAIAIVKDDQVIYANGFGVRTQGKTATVDPHTVFQIGSIAKGFTAALIAKQIDAGNIDWDDRIVDYLPDFAMQDRWITQHITVKDLLTQRTGMSAYALFYPALLGADRDDIIHAIRHVNIDHGFRNTFTYQNSSYLVLARLIEKLYNTSWENALETHLLTPLDMQHASTSFANYLNTTNRAGFHRYQQGQIELLADSWPHHKWADIYAPAAGINATLYDMTKWLRFQLNHGTVNNQSLIHSDTMRTMWQPVTKLDNSSNKLMFYGTGWFYQENKPYPIIWHGGQTPGSKAIIAMIPQEKLGIIVLTNAYGTKLPLALALRFFDQYYGRIPSDWSERFLQKRIKKDKKQITLTDYKKTNASGIHLKQYAGVYYNPVYGQVRIENIDDKLLLTLGDNHTILTLTPHTTHYFLLHWPELDNKTSRVYFNRSHNKVTGFMIERFKKEAGGHFIKLSSAISSSK